jgi:WD40 repeat protein
MNQLSAKRWLLAVAAGVVMVGLTPMLPGQVNDAGGRLLQRIGTGQLRHGSRILCLAYSPNGQLLVGGGGSDPIRVWDTKTGQQRYTCPDAWVNSIVFTTRGSEFITGGMSKTIRRWETSTGKEVGQLVGHNKAVRAMALNGLGDMLASGDLDGTIIVWEVGLNKKIIELKEHKGEVTCVAFSPRPDEFNPILVSGGMDRLVCVWDADTQQLRKKIDAGCGVLAVAISQDSKRIFSAGDDNLIRVWEAKTGKLLETLRGHSDMVASLALGATTKIVDDESVLDRGKLLISAGRDKTIRIWQADNLSVQPRVIARHYGDSDALAVSRDGKHIATAGLNATIRIFETATGKELFADGDPQAELVGLTLSPDGQTLVAISAPGIVYVWDAATGKQVNHWATGQDGGEIKLAFTPDGQSIVTAADTVRFWDPRSGKQRSELPANDKERAPVAGLAFSSDGRLLAVGKRNRQVTVYVLGQENPTSYTFAYTAGHPGALAFSTDNRLLAVSGGSEIVIMDCAGPPKEVRRFPTKEAPPKTIVPEVWALAFSPDRKTIAAACWDGPIRFLDFTTGKEAGICEGNLSVPYAIAFSHDGRTLLSGSADATVRLWEPFSGAQLAELKGHAGPVNGVALSPDGKRAYSAGADTNVVIWDTTGYGKAGPPQQKLSPVDLRQAWTEMASDNAALSRQVVWKLIANPQGVAADLKNHVALVDVARIEKLFGDLDSDMFDERDAATKELEKYGRWLEGRLHEALEKLPSLEYKRRVEDMLKKLDQAGSLTLAQEQRRLRRAMMVLETIGDAPSVDLLQRLTKQAPEKAFRNEADTTLLRMGKAPAKTAGK